MRLLILTVVMFLTLAGFGINQTKASTIYVTTESVTLSNREYARVIFPDNPKVKNQLVKFLHNNIDQNDQRKVKITASILALTLGPFGVHRLYLGTTPLIPAVYVATVGGGVGILPFIDFIAIVFSKDLTPYMNNNQIFMWVKKQ